MHHLSVQKFRFFGDFTNKLKIIILLVGRYYKNILNFLYLNYYLTKINKKLSKSSLSKSMDAKWKRVERNTITLVNNKECNITEHSVDNVSKSTELYQTNPIQYRGKSIGMKEEITGLLKLLVIERKKQEDLERAVKAAYQCCNNDFISMKDVQSPNDSEQAK